MVVRFLALLLTVIMMTSAIAQAAGSPDRVAATASGFDPAPDAVDLDPPILPRSVVLATPVAPSLIAFALPLLVSGRMHAVLVFRPPRLLASR